MQEERNEIFDRQVRDLLDGAEIKAPRRVWRAVSSGLPSASPLAAFVSGIRSFGQQRGRSVLAYACAAAACLTLGLFLFRNAATSDPASPVSDTAQLTAGLEPSGSNYSPEPGNLIASHSGSAEAESRTGVSINAVSGDRWVTDSASKEHNGYDNGKVAAQTVDTDAEGTPDCTSAEHKGSAARFVDPFEAEDLAVRIREENKSGRISLALNGTAGGNDSELGSYLGRVFHYADGAESTERLGLTENGASSFGIPLSFGLGVKIQLSHHFYAGTGLTYTFLERRFPGAYNSGDGSMPVNGLVLHNMQYIGIPLDIYYEPFNLKSFRFYLFAGGAGELCTSNRYRMPGESLDLKTKVKGPIFSVNAGAGVEFKFNNTVGVYLDPSVKYYFKNNHPRSVRTDKPFSVNFDIGLRFNI